MQLDKEATGLIRTNACIHTNGLIRIRIEWHDGISLDKKNVLVNFKQIFTDKITVNATISPDSRTDDGILANSWGNGRHEGRRG